MFREGQNIDLYRDSWTTSANLADHQWSAEQTLEITEQEISFQSDWDESNRYLAVRFWFNSFLNIQNYNNSNFVELSQALVNLIRKVFCVKFFWARSENYFTFLFSPSQTVKILTHSFSLSLRTTKLWHNFR